MFKIKGIKMFFTIWIVFLLVLISLSAQAQATKNRYDKAGRKVETTKIDKQGNSTTYDDAGRKTGYETYYDKEGRKIGSGKKEVLI
ncbi:hypothetical protein AGMMS49574_02750 [Bacteroidia bacterium]|nr:hypothetical protein AGMMS49574_02750 [Bacteroidia bacterium]